MKESLQPDLFTVSVVEPPWRDNRDAMEYPFLALQKRRTRPIEFSRNGLSLEVHAPAKFGIATIWDWDLVIFAASHLNEAVEDGRKPSPRIRFVPYDCLRQIGRGTSGRHYHELAQATRRLMATLVITNIRSQDQLESGEESGFHWLCGFKIPKKYTRVHFTQDDPDGEPDPARPWEIELPPWLYNAILRQRDILAVHPDYFQLSGGIEGAVADRGARSCEGRSDRGGRLDHGGQRGAARDRAPGLGRDLPGNAEAHGQGERHRDALGRGPCSPGPETEGQDAVQCGLGEHDRS